VYQALGCGWQLREGQQLLPDGTRAEMKQRTNWGRLPDDGPRLPLTEDDSAKQSGETDAH
jgi:hypothetical protein